MVYDGGHQKASKLDKGLRNIRSKFKGSKARMKEQEQKKIEAANRKRSLEDKKTQEVLDREIELLEKSLRQDRTKFPAPRLAQSATGSKGKGKEKAVGDPEDHADGITTLPPLPSPPFLTPRSTASSPGALLSTSTASASFPPPLRRAPSAPGGPLHMQETTGLSSTSTTTGQIQRPTALHFGNSTAGHSGIETDVQRRQLEQVFESLVDQVSRNDDKEGELDNEFARDLRLAIQSALKEPVKAEEPPPNPPGLARRPEAFPHDDAPRPTIITTPAQVADLTLQQNNNPWRNGTYLKYRQGAGSQFIVELEGSPHNTRSVENGSSQDIRLVTMAQNSNLKHYRPKSTKTY